MTLGPLDSRGGSAPKCCFGRNTGMESQGPFSLPVPHSISSDPVEVPSPGAQFPVCSVKMGLARSWGCCIWVAPVLIFTSGTYRPAGAVSPLAGLQKRLWAWLRDPQYFSGAERKELLGKRKLGILYRVKLYIHFIPLEMKKKIFFRRKAKQICCYRPTLKD